MAATGKDAHNKQHEDPGDTREDSKSPGRASGLLKRVVLSILFASFALGVVMVAGLSWLDQKLQQPQVFLGQTFKIEKGDSLKVFAARLQQAGVVDEAYSLIVYARYKGLAGSLHTGIYRFEDGLNLVQVLDAITSGDYRLSHSFTFVQGSTFNQFRNALAVTSSVQQTVAGQSDADVLALIDPAAIGLHPEGLFFPETYAFDPGARDLDIMRRAYQTMQATLANLWAERDPEIEIKSAYEALILASIIEKETGLASERKQISGVFMNRLRLGMKLQTDPTVIYGMGASYTGNIRRKDLKRDTPYNTYTRFGLPPTPICLPGQAALEAALHPLETDALYFVARGDGSGGHRFSKTLTEHNKAVQQYLKARRKSG
jgi:UPF0755 protein